MQVWPTVCMRGRSRDYMCFWEGIDFKGGLRCIDQFLGQEGQILVNGEDGWPGSNQWQQPVGEIVEAVEYFIRIVCQQLFGFCSGGPGGRDYGYAGFATGGDVAGGVADVDDGVLVEVGPLLQDGGDPFLFYGAFRGAGLNVFEVTAEAEFF